MSKTAIAPIVTVLLLVVSNIFGVKFPDGLDQQVTDVVTNALAIYIIIAHGIMKNHVSDKTTTPTPPKTPAPVESTVESNH